MTSFDDNSIIQKKSTENRKIIDVKKTKQITYIDLFCG